MKRFWVRHARVFADVVEVARTAVRDIDWDDLPSALRPVAKYSGGTLPPPLAGALLDTLVTNDWFRAKVADVDGADNGAVQAFLVQGPGWWEIVVEHVLEASDSVGTADTESLSAELVAVQSKLSEAQRPIARTNRSNPSNIEATTSSGASLSATPLALRQPVHGTLPWPRQRHCVVSVTRRVRRLER